MIFSFKSKLLKYFFLFISFCVAFLVLYLNRSNISKIFRARSKTNERLVPDRLFTVQRGELPIGVFLSGTVNAKEKHKLALDVNFRTTLTYVVPENTRVKAGDVLAKFDTDDLMQKIEELELNLQGLNKEREIALEEISIQKSANDADIKVASDKLKEAEAAFLKYRKLEGPRDADTQRLNVDEALKRYEEQKRIYEDALKDFQQTIFMEESDKKKAIDKLSDIEKKMLAEETNFNTQTKERKIFRRFTYPDTLRRLQNQLEQEKLNLNRTKVRATSLLLQKENQLAKIDAQIKKVQYDLDKHKSYVDKMKLVAPVDGIVTYGDPDRRWGAPEIKVGMEVKPKEVLLTIPDMSNLVIDFDLPEQYRARVKQDDIAIVRPDSIPGLKVEGRISQIAPTPVNQIHWDRNSPRIYPSKVELLEQPEALVSGMSVQVQIVTGVLKNVLFVPVEAVFDDGGKFFVFLKRDGMTEEREVEVGESNDYYIEIKNGLAEGDIVFLYRPFQK